MLIRLIMIFTKDFHCPIILLSYIITVQSRHIDYLCLIYMNLYERINIKYSDYVSKALIRYLKYAKKNFNGFSSKSCSNKVLKIRMCLLL